MKYFFFSRHREIIQSGEEGQQSILANIRSTIETEKERCIAKEAELEVSNAQDRLQFRLIDTKSNGRPTDLFHNQNMIAHNQLG